MNLNRTILFLFSFLTLMLSSCNLHIVDEGQLYRSGQMTQEELTKAVDTLGIKTIINLRGSAPDKEWYRKEKKAAQRLGVEHIDIRMSAKRLPHRDDLLELLKAFQSAERPILIHCQGGADRTGEASALYKMIYMGESKEVALKQLNLFGYGHVKQRFPAKRYFIKHVWQGEEWMLENYKPCQADYLFYDKADCAKTE